MNRTDSTAASIRTCLIPLSLTAAVVLLFELWLMSEWMAGRMDGILVLAMHAACVLAFALLVYVCRKFDADFRLAAVGLLMVLAFGPLGCGGVLVAALVHGLSSGKAEPVEFRAHRLLPVRITRSQKRTLRRIRLWADESQFRHKVLFPLAELIPLKTRDDKLALVDLLERNYQPEYVLAFKLLLADSDESVRRAVIDAIARLREAYARRRIFLENASRRRPADAGHSAELARLYDDFANARLNDADVQADLRQKAQEEYWRLYETFTDEVGYPLALGRLLARAGRTRQAVRVFEHALRDHEEEVGIEQRLAYWECLYKQKRYEDLKRDVRKLIGRNGNVLDPLYEDLLAAWAGEAVQATGAAS